MQVLPLGRDAFAIEPANEVTWLPFPEVSVQRSPFHESAMYCPTRPLVTGDMTGALLIEYTESAHNPPVGECRWESFHDKNTM